MLMKRITFAGLAVSTVIAAGIGSYVAVRQNATQTRADNAPSDSPSLTATFLQPAEESIDASETLVSPTTTEAPPIADNSPSQGEIPTSSTSQPSLAHITQPRDTDSPKARQARTKDQTDQSDSAPTDRTSSTPAPPPPGVRSPAQVTTLPETPQTTDRTGATTPTRATTAVPTVDGWSLAEDTAAPPTGRSPYRALKPNGLGAARRPTAPRLAYEPTPSSVALEVAADSVIGLHIDTAVSTQTAQVEDQVEAKVDRDVLVAEQIAIPAGARMLGSVVLVVHGGRLRDASRLGIRFHTLVKDDGSHLPVSTETIYREGKPAGKDSVAKIGGAAIGGAILGSLFGGSRGAQIGGSIGAAGGTAAAISGEAEPAELPSGSLLTVRLSRPVTVTIYP